MESELLSTTESLKVFLDRLQEHCEAPASRCYVDLEGNNLSRHGTLSLITILLKHQGKVYLVDVTQLKWSAFSTPNDRGTTLKEILESKSMIKVFFDIRNDSDALYSLYQIEVDGIEDLQLMELASRERSRKCVNGLARCIETDARIGFLEKMQWKRTKDEGHRLFDPARGGSYDVFDQRPLSTDVIKYCCQDVQLLPHLYTLYKEKLCDAWWLKIQSETAARIRLSQTASFNGKGRHMALGPHAWNGWSPSLEERRTRTLLDEPAISDAEVRDDAGEPKRKNAAPAQDFINGSLIEVMQKLAVSSRQTSIR